MKVRLDEHAMYGLAETAENIAARMGYPLSSLPPSSQLVWTDTIKRSFVLIASALRCDEPVLLVGETGSGKTSLCELFARVMGKKLYSVSCHQNTETADLLGGQRPRRNRIKDKAEAIRDARTALEGCGFMVPPLDEDGNGGDEGVNSYMTMLDKALSKKSIHAEHTTLLRNARLKVQRTLSLFEWHDGPLVQAMLTGSPFLLDEISLADDSVLERLNSILEPSRTLVLAEKGGQDVEQVQLTAAPGFKLVATMNPGGDYGKKELSPALRNRFTEIWVPVVAARKEKHHIIERMWSTTELQAYSEPLLDFTEWLGETLGENGVVGLRDILVSSSRSIAASFC